MRVRRKRVRLRINEDWGSFGDSDERKFIASEWVAACLSMCFLGKDSERVEVHVSVI